MSFSFLWGNTAEHVYAVPFMTIDDIVARLQTVETTFDANVLRRIREHAVRGLLSPSKWVEIISSTYGDSQQLVI
jgi:hypothetical protein